MRTKTKFDDGMTGWFIGDSISYYTYLSLVLSEIIYIWNFMPNNAVIFTILLSLSCVVILVCGILKSIWICTKIEFVISVTYCALMMILLVIGCVVDFLQSLFLFGIPYFVTVTMVILRNFQTMRYIESKNMILRAVNGMFANCLSWILISTVTTLLPLGIFVYMLRLTVSSDILVVLFSYIYGICIPYIVWIEDCFMYENIFEIGYQVLWSKEIESLMNNLNISREILGYEEFWEAVYNLRSNIKVEPEKARIEFYDELKKLQVKLIETKKQN